MRAGNYIAYLPARQMHQSFFFYRYVVPAGTIVTSRSHRDQIRIQRNGRIEEQSHRDQISIARRVVVLWRAVGTQSEIASIIAPDYAQSSKPDAYHRFLPRYI